MNHPLLLEHRGLSRPHGSYECLGKISEAQRAFRANLTFGCTTFFGESIAWTDFRLPTLTLSSLPPSHPPPSLLPLRRRFMS
jgi:hypothetical protein